MVPRKMLERPSYVYPYDEWRMLQKRYYEPFLALSETIFSVANGGRCVTVKPFREARGTAILRRLALLLTLGAVKMGR